MLALAVAALLCVGACRAPTQHTGKRPIATRRARDMTPDKTLEQRLVERESRLGDVAAREGSHVAAEAQLVGVGTTQLFHEPDCAELADVPRADRVLFVSIYDALDGRYAPCRACNPR